VPPQTDGRALWEPRGEIYLQIIQQKWREEEREWRQRGGREECGERERERADKSGKESEKEGGTKREARTEPGGCAERQASPRQAHREHTESVHQN